MTHFKSFHKFVCFFALVFVLISCTSLPAAVDEKIIIPSTSSQPVTPSTAQNTLDQTQAKTLEATITSTPEESTPTSLPEISAPDPSATENPPSLPGTPSAPPGPDDWKALPAIPTISSLALEIYRQGLAMGNDPHRFSKVGDCQNVSSYFLSPFEFPSAYNLGEYTELQETIDWYKGSFTRESLAVKGGFNVAAVLSPLRADPKQCEKDESPVQCELRIFNPSVAIVSMETWWSGEPDKYERYMRQLLDYLVGEGVLPILATKADNLEGEHQINRTLAALAWEYDIPLWNFWASVQDLPDKGLTEDGFHLTLGNYFYDNPATTQTGWSRRNLTALQALDAVKRAEGNQPPR